DDLEARIMAVGMDAEQAPALAERAHERRHHLLRLEFERRTRPVRLRGDHHVVVGEPGAALRDHLVEEEPVVVAVEHLYRRMLVDRVARLGAQAGLSPKTGNPVYEHPTVVVLYRDDYRFLLDEVIPKRGAGLADYD